MDFRYNDDPMRISQEALKKLDLSPPGTWVCQKKVDDWRLSAYKDNGRWKFYAKRAERSERAKQPPAGLVKELESLRIPDGVAFDMGWVGPRDVYKKLNGRHYFVLWDVLYNRGQWIGKEPYIARLSLLGQLVMPTENVQLVESVTSNMYDYFLKQRDDPLSEGVVLKRASSTLVGDFDKAATNPMWRKVKYRDIRENTIY